MPRVSVITPFSRGIKELEQLLRDFKNQTYRDFELIIVRDGKIPENIQKYIDTNRHKKEYSNVRFSWCKRDPAHINGKLNPTPRNYGTSIAKGEWTINCDDDDRYRSTYIESLMMHTHDNYISVVQMACRESRMYKNGDVNKFVMIPEIGNFNFPVICHVGTPCFVVKRSWVLAEPWRYEPEPDFRFIKRICEKFNPVVQIIGGVQVDVDGFIRGMRDWVTTPPFYRE
jgi:glycosyltransferase involved in cell wall biosynthesis